MTRTLTLAMIALLGLSAVALGQTSPSTSGCGTETWSTDKMAYVGIPCSGSAPSASTSGCGTETWSTDKMAYVGVPCGDSATPAPQQAAAPLTDTQYCGALVKRYDTYLNEDGRRGGMRSTDVAANVAAAKCRAGDSSGIADLERALKDAKVDLPPRT
jgi:hypothetical protein